MRRDPGEAGAGAVAAPAGEHGRGLSVLFGIGFGDGIASYRAWRGQGHLESEVASTYSSETFEFLQATGLGAVLVSTFGPRRTLQDGSFRLFNEPKLAYAVWGGLGYHWAQWCYAQQLTHMARTHGAKVLVLDSGMTHWIFLLPAALRGLKVVPNFHNARRPPHGNAASLVRRALFGLDSWFLRRHTRAALGVSPACERGYLPPNSSQHHFEPYLAQFCGDDFARIPEADFDADELHMAFVGRIEIEKGVFDLLEVVRRLRARGHRLHLSVGGSGRSLPALAAALAQAAVADPGLVTAVRLLGSLQRHEVLALYRRCHMVVVPTRSGFDEGFPKVCAEAALAGRVVVASRHTEAADLLPGVVVEFDTDSVPDLQVALEGLMGNRARMRELGACSRAAAARFTDRSMSLAQALHRLQAKGCFETPAARSDPFTA